MIDPLDVAHIEETLRAIVRERSNDEELAPLVDELLLRLNQTEPSGEIQDRRRNLIDAIGLLAVLAIQGDRKNLDQCLYELSEICGAPLNEVEVLLPGADRVVTMSSNLPPRSKADADFIFNVREALRE